MFRLPIPYVAAFLVALALAGIGRPGAETAKAEPLPPAMQAAWDAAAEWWGVAPTGCASLTVEVSAAAALTAEFPDTPPGYAVLGRATIPPGGGPPVACAVRLAVELLADPGELCQVARHEYVHILGLDHAPEGIMRAELETADAPDCYASRQRRKRPKHAKFRRGPAIRAGKAR
jgi:hypothetical protein